MESNVIDGYVNDHMDDKRKASVGTKVRYVNDNDIRSSVQYDSIDYDSLGKFERAKDKHVYLDLNSDKEASKVTNNQQCADGFSKVDDGSTTKTKGLLKLILIFALLILLGVAIAFGVLYFKQSEDSPTKSPQTLEEHSASPRVETTAGLASEPTTDQTSSKTESITPATTAPRNFTSEETANIGAICKDYNGLMPHPDECQAYYNCSNYYEFIPRFFEQYLMECPYPKLYSTDTMSCENFEKVTCGERKEAKSGCDYRGEQCVGHCSPCNDRYPSCEGKPDGFNADVSRMWSPFYVICHKERFVVREFCPADTEGGWQIFSPYYDACVSLDRIPPEHGGRLPNCTDKADGTYPDEYKRCNRYTLCASGQYVGYETCSSSEDVFDEVLKACRNHTEASYCTCGNVGCTC